MNARGLAAAQKHVLLLLLALLLPASACWVYTTALKALL